MLSVRVFNTYDWSQHSLHQLVIRWTFLCFGPNADKYRVMRLTLTKNLSRFDYAHFSVFVIEAAIKFRNQKTQSDQIVFKLCQLGVLVPPFIVNEELPLVSQGTTWLGGSVSEACPLFRRTY